MKNLHSRAASRALLLLALGLFFTARCGNGGGSAEDGDAGLDMPDGVDAVPDGDAPDADEEPDSLPDATDLPPDPEPDGECYGPPPPRDLSVHTGGGSGAASDSGALIVLTGTAPADVAGTVVEHVRVDGSERGVHFDPESGLWTWVRYLSDADRDVAAEALDGSGTALASVSAHVAAGPASPVPEDFLFYPTDHFLGTWMFTWFSGDPGWACSSPWAPVETFDLWDGSPDWARKQILDQMDAGIDVVGLQMDWNVSSGPRAYRWDNVVHAVEGARSLLDEGMAPPKLFPFVDTAIIAEFFSADFGRTLNLASPGDFDHFYSFIFNFYQAFNAVMGQAFSQFAMADMGGRPFVGLWHSVTLDGESNDAVAALKARFSTDFGVEPYFVAHPNDWSDLSNIDEITLMFGPPQHFHAGGRDGNGGETMNIEAGFWNPISNTFYLPREGGVHFLSAWDQAMARRGDVEHLYIDSWNETGEGSGIFEAQPVTYTDTDTGPCGSFVNLHNDGWGDDSRAYIDVTSERSAQWTDRPADDALAAGHDVPASLEPGEQRWVSVVMRNEGGSGWTEGSGLALQAGGDAAGFFIASSPLKIMTDELQALGRVPRGGVAAFHFLLAAPCEPGSYTLTFQMARSGAAFGETLSVDIQVE